MDKTSETAIVAHMKAIWELAKDRCPSGLLLLSIHRNDESGKIWYLINNCAYPYSDDKGPDIKTPIDITYAEPIAREYL